MSGIVNNSLSIPQRLQQVADNIAEACRHSRRQPSEITTIIVTKTASVPAITEVIKAGYTNLGENRVQHLKQVAEDIQQCFSEDDQKIVNDITWHMIGHLQRNKVKHVLKISHIIQSVDTLRLAEDIDETAEKLALVPNVLLQVNCSGEPQKYGVPVGAATHLAEQFCTMKNIRLSGLMTMAPLTRDKDEVRASFVRARELFEEIQGKGYGGKHFKHLSMGMSQDYQIAVEEGATMLRIGSAIFA
jgi:PLP dependent protein